MLQSTSHTGYNPDIYITYNIKYEDIGLSIYKLLLNRLKFSFELIKKAKYSGEILLDMHAVHTNVLLAAGQQLIVSIKEERHLPCRPYCIDLDVVFENNDVLIINKPAPLPVLCGPIDTGNTLQNAVYSYWNCPDNYVYRPINRLDCGTSGLMIIAKNAYAQQFSQRQLHSKDFLREYIAICHGRPENSSGVIELAIARKSPTSYMVDPKGKPSKTHYVLIESKNNKSMLKLVLETGRTHQIRVHCSYLGFGILGDYIYFEEHAKLKNRFCLHSYKIRIKLPFENKEREFIADLPKVFYEVFDE